MKSQHIILEALESAVYDAIDAGTIDAGVLDYAPKSHTFVREPGDEDDVEAIKLVGARDVAAKIAFYSRVLDGAPQ